MRAPLFLLGFAAVFSTAALGEDDCRCWTPSADEIGAMEAQIAEQPLPLGRLDRYARHYAGVGGRRSRLDGYVESNGVVIEGPPLFLRFDPSLTRGSPARRILGALIPAGGDDLPRVHVEQRPADLTPKAEGCVTVFDADRTRLISFTCAPAVAQVTELEDLLRQHGGPKLEEYRRYYSLLVMHDGRKVIHGDLVPASGIAVRIDFGRSSFIQFDGKCGAFDTVWYDPSSKIAAWQCSGKNSSTDEWGIRVYDPASENTMRGGEAARAVARLFGDPSDH
jgi:hypothetical protein